MKYKYIDRVSEEEEVMRIPGIELRDLKLFVGSLKDYVRCGVKRIESYCEFWKLGRTVKGDAIVLLKELLKVRGSEQQTLFNTEQLKKRLG